MSDTDFYNRNLFRTYPFAGYPYVMPSDIPDSLLVDMSVVFFESSGFDASLATHLVHPREMYESGGSWIYSFLIAAPGAAVDNLTVTVTIATKPTKYDVVPFTFSVSGISAGYGFIVIGDPDDVTMGGPPSLPAISNTYPILERALVQVQKGHVVDHFEVFNEPRTFSELPCMSSSGGESSYQPAPYGDSVCGDVRFREGYNCSITVLPTANAIKFSAKRGAGDGEACADIPKTWAEMTLASKGLPLDGAVKCDEVITSINGLEPDSDGEFSIRGGRGVDITNNRSTNTITIAPRGDVEDCNA